jgi:hypothetical protein
MANPSDATIYITPTTTVHSTYSEARDFIEKEGALPPFEDKKPLSIVALTQGKRNLVVGEPGIGKSLLLAQIKDHLEKGGVRAALIDLRESAAMKAADEFLAVNGQSSGALLLDALDEVKSSDFPEVLRRLVSISAEYPHVSLFLSSRWVFIGTYAASFSEYRFITISPFTQKQVHDYLVAAGQKEADIALLLTRIMSFGHKMLVIQIPRYLSFLAKYLKSEGVEAASRVSRNELFEYFIYASLTREGEKFGKDHRALIKRVLEKLALTMEIYQSNVITEDELMTFFDDLRSDLKSAALVRIDTRVFYEYSLLRVSREGLHKVEFDNTEFQEYLAAKEITRFADPNRAVFSFAADPELNELYPSWFNTLSFLVDMEPHLLEQLVEFSGLRAQGTRVLDETFFTFMSRVDSRKCPPELRRKLFRDVFSYHERARQWIPLRLCESLREYWSPSDEEYLKELVMAAEGRSGSQRYVTLGNVCFILAQLLRGGVAVDRHLWRSKLLVYAVERDKNTVLQRHALFALGYLGDSSVIDELPSLMDGDELVMQAFVSMHAELAPDHPKSLEYFVEAIRRDDLQGRYGLYATKTAEAMKYFLRSLIGDESFRIEFFDHASILGEQDQVLVNKIEQALDDDVRHLCKDVLVQVTHYDIAHQAERSVLVSGLWRILKSAELGFVLDMVDRLLKLPDGKSRLYYASRFIAQVISKEDVGPLLLRMLSADEPYIALDVMRHVKASGRADAAEIYEAGRPYLAEMYKNVDAGKESSPVSTGKERPERLIKQFRVLLEPEHGKYSQNVFSFFNMHVEILEPLLTDTDRKRIATLLDGTVFRHMDPGKYDLTISQEKGGASSYTTSSAVHIFAEALLTAKRLGHPVAPHRQKILNLLPFAYGEQLKAIFELVPNIKPGEMTPILEIYRRRRSDLWRHNPGNLVRAVEQYHLSDAGVALRAFIVEPGWAISVRQEALSVCESVAPNVGFLKSVFARFELSADGDERELAMIANGLLITKYSEEEAVKWRLREVVCRATGFVSPVGKGAHQVGELEEEIVFGRKFATPLMQVKDPRYLKEYLHLLDEALAIWARGTEYQEYASYLWAIVYAYFDNLKEALSYAPLRALEDKIRALPLRDGTNWLGARMVHLRKAYLAYLGKPDKIAKAIAKYNEMREWDPKKIRNSSDLFQHVQNACEVDLGRWIEGEGAYDILTRRVSASGHQEYEKLIQKTLKTQIENIMHKRGFQVEVYREVQLLDEKRPDMVVRYGFAGPIIIEVKLTSNKEIQGMNVGESKSYLSMERYMQGYGASDGIFMVIDNRNARNLARVTEVFQKIPGVRVLKFSCRTQRTVRRGRTRRKKKMAAHLRKGPTK